MKKTETEKKLVQIEPPTMQTVLFTIEGTAPLVIHRFSEKSKLEMLSKMEAGSVATKGKKRNALDKKAVFEAAQYRSPEGWHGFNASCIRNALIRACSLVNFKMTLAKMCLFVVADGRDALNPEYQLVRIWSKPPRMSEIPVGLPNGSTDIRIRPAYDEWQAKLRITFDSDQFSAKDVANLLHRAGMQVGIAEGRPSSSDSGGMGWGTFKIINEKPE